MHHYLCPQQDTVPADRCVMCNGMDDGIAGVDAFDLCDADGFPLDLSDASGSEDDYDDPEEYDVVVEDLGWPAQWDDLNPYATAQFILSDPARFSHDPNCDCDDCEGGAF